MADAVAAALQEAPPADRDAAVVQLIRRYAQLLDAARDAEGESDLYNDLGPKLLAALTAAGLTLAGRRGQGGVAGDGADGGSKFDELRARRAKRVGAG